MRRRAASAHLPASRRFGRGGTTLTEVLMSLLVMGIGVVSVATLFPLSVLKSVRATQGTTATSLRYSAEALIDGSRTDPVYDVTDEDGDGDVVELRANRRTPDLPVSPNPSTLLAGCSTAAIALDPDGDSDPTVNDTNYIGGATHAYGYDSDDHREGFYIVDPLGYWRLRQQGSAHAAARLFGDWSALGTAPFFTNRFSLNVPDHSSDPPGSDFAHLRPVFGFSGTPGSFTGTSAEIELNTRIAEQFVGVPDSFVNLGDGRASESTVTIAADSVDFAPGTADLSMFLSGSTPDWVTMERGKVTVFANDGRRSVVRDFDVSYTSGPASTTRNWSGAGADLSIGRIQFATPLPGWIVGNADRVTVEAVEDRYTWMLAVRNRSERGTRQAVIDVVVFFRRAFGLDDEHVYLVAQDFGTVATFNRRKKEYKEYFVAWNDAAGEPRPDVNEASWMFDPVNFRWHKIGQVFEDESFTPALNAQRRRDLGNLPAAYTPDRRIRFRLEGSAVADEVILRGIFMQGVVDVYPLRPKTSE